MKKAKRVIVFAIVIAVLLFSFTACTQKAEELPTNVETTEAPETVEPITMFIAGVHPAEDTQSMGHLELERRLEAESKGVFQVEVKLNSVMGETDDVTEQAIQGVPVLNASDPGRLAAFVPEYGLIGMPYIFPDYTYLNKIMDTNLYKQWEKDFEAKGIKLVTSNGLSGLRSWVTNMPVREPADLKGVKIRTIGNDLFVNSINAMGAVATTMPWGETYQAVEQGVVDGAEAQIPGIYSLRLYELLDYVSLSEHFTLIASMVTGTKFFDSLPEKYQAMLMTQAKETYRDNQQIVLDKSEQFIEEMKAAGVTFLEIDKQPFIDAVQPVYTQMGFEDLRNQLYAELGI